MKQQLLIVGLIMSAGVVGLAAAAGTQRPAPTIDPPPVVAAMTCTDPLVMGGPTSCKDTTTWYEYAKADCAARGYTTVTILGYSTSCGGSSYSYVKYQCCR